MMRAKDWLLAAMGTVILCGISYVSFAPEIKTEDCTRIYFDQGGESYARTLSGILKSFNENSIVMSDIKDYKAGDIERCQVNFYLGSVYDNVIPRSFMSDFASTQQKAVWLGYNIWEMGTLMEKTFGYRFVRMTRLETVSNGLEGYFRDIYYKGKIFERDVDHNEQVELVQTREKRSIVIAEVRHSLTRERIPYIIKNQNRHYVADIPLNGHGPLVGRYAVFRDFLADVFGKSSLPRGEELANLTR